MKNIFLKLIFNFLKKLHDLQNDLAFLPERTKFEKVEKIVVNLYNNVIRISNLKEALNYGLVLKST